MRFIDNEEDLRDETRDFPDHKIWKIWGNELHFKREGQHGWWKIYLTHGRLPKYMDGLFITFWDAEQAAKRYVRTKKTRVVDYNFKPQEQT